ncbi:MAG TPA: sensor histidine kinase [Rectinemataceae bacterium]|nr:sensor histidine kinase [Rectinemataceae bacterium]
MEDDVTRRLASQRGTRDPLHGHPAEKRESPRPLSIRLKLMLYFLALVFLPLLSLGIIGPSLYAHAIERETTNYVEHMIAQVTVNIDYHVLDIERLIDFLAEDESVLAYLERGTALPSERSSIIKTMSAISRTHPEIAGILVVSDDDDSITDDFYRITRDPLTSERWYTLAREVPGVVRLFSRPIGRNLRSTHNYGPEEVVSIVKAIVDPGDGRLLGEILVDMKLSTIERIFKGTSLGAHGFLFIADPEGELVYAPVNDIVYRIPVTMQRRGAASAIIRVGGIDYRVLSQISSRTGWQTIGVFSLSETLREVMLIRYWTLIIAGATMGLAIIGALFFTFSIARPVLGLKSLMKRAEGGDLSVRFSGGNGDEISELGEGFNEMIERIQSLIDQVYSEQLAKREGELQVLQEQIKPHFLYNTLDTIQWMAQENRVDDVVSMVGSLTTLFRIGLSRGRELIALHDEIEHVKSYLAIQKMRYEDKFDFEIRIADALPSHRILRLILQPLVENAIYHGVKERRGKGWICVESRVEEGELRLAVRDDGAGMTAERLETLNLALEREDGKMPGLGYGVQNVHQRIRLTFGRPFGLSFTSVLGKGTVVLVRHPLLKEEDI